MADTEIFTESEEMYLVTVARLVESGVEPPVPISLLASEMNIGAISANQMVRKLEECGLVAYFPYKGVSLTEAGEQAALRVLRHRRLWEVFLVEHLQFSPAEAETQACRIEHVFPDNAAERLAAYLGRPTTNPQGKIIPQADHSGSLEPRHSAAVRLDQLGAGQSAVVHQVSQETIGRAFLANQGIFPGAKVVVLAAAGSGELLLETVPGNRLQLNAALAQAIWVQAGPPDPGNTRLVN